MANKKRSIDMKLNKTQTIVLVMFIVVVALVFHEFVESNHKDDVALVATKVSGDLSLMVEHKNDLLIVVNLCPHDLFDVIIATEEGVWNVPCLTSLKTWTSDDNTIQPLLPTNPRSGVVCVMGHYGEHNTGYYSEFTDHGWYGYLK